MKAIVIEGSELAMRSDVPRPVPGPTELLVRIHAAGVNNADLVRSAYHFGKHEGPPIAGLEYAGEVVEAGSAARTRTSTWARSRASACN